MTIKPQMSSPSLSILICMNDLLWLTGYEVNEQWKIKNYFMVAQEITALKYISEIVLNYRSYGTYIWS